MTTIKEETGLNCCRRLGNEEKLHNYKGSKTRVWAYSEYFDLPHFLYLYQDLSLLLANPKICSPSKPTTFCFVPCCPTVFCLSHL